MKNDNESKTVKDSLYEALVADESPSLSEHDRVHHPNGFDPDTDHCTLRENLTREDEVDSGAGAGSEPKDDYGRIAEIYKEWVEEDVPSWVGELSPEDAKQYAELLDDAMKHGTDDDSNAFEKLEEFEAPRRTKEQEKQEEKEKEERRQLSESHKEVVEASRRLGTDAYMPAADLKKLLNLAKQHISDPRWAQKAKDIETIMADREAKKSQQPKEGGKYVGDESPREQNMNIIMEALIQGLSS